VAAVALRQVEQLSVVVAALPQVEQRSAAEAGALKEVEQLLAAMAGAGCPAAGRR